MLLVLLLFTVCLNGCVPIHQLAKVKCKIRMFTLPCIYPNGQTLNNMMSTFVDAGSLVS